MRTHLLFGLAACGPRVELDAGSYAFTLEETVSDACGFSEIGRDPVDVASTEDGFQWEDEDGNIGSFAWTDGSAFAGSYTVQGGTSDCGFDVDIDVEGEVETEQRATISDTVTYGTESLGCTPLPLPCEVEASWTLSRE